MNDYLKEILLESLKQFELEETPEIQLEAPKMASHGDASSNIAMMLAKPLRNNPRAIATQIVEGLKYNDAKISAVEIAGPGFINFRYAEDYLYDELASIISEGESFGKTDSNEGLKVQIEFVSANPTGPLTVGHGRNAVLGDTVARLMEWTGAKVDREYYFNDAGRQMRVLAESLKSRYYELLDKINVLHSFSNKFVEQSYSVFFPKGGYEGQYIYKIAFDLLNKKYVQAQEKAFKNVYSNFWEDSQLDNYKISSRENFRAKSDLFFNELNRELKTNHFKTVAKREIFKDIKSTLKRLNIKMDSFFNESSLYRKGDIESVVERLRAKDLVYEADGATWFKTTEFGKEKDTVLIKSTGEPTYRLPDIAYHANKLDRGYDLCIDIFGADHIATYPDVLSGIKSLGYDPEKIDVVVYQFVTIVKDGKPFKMSTRKANFVTLDELMDEVGADVTRFFFLMRSPNTHLEFDIAQAKEAGEKNPVFYLQYAHARICSILRKAEEEYSFDKDVDLKLLKADAEILLMKTLFKFPKSIQSAAEAREPHRLINYLNEVASAFTTFYHDCRIIGVDADLAQARIALANTTAQVLNNGLTILGITAPERM